MSRAGGGQGVEDRSLLCLAAAEVPSLRIARPCSEPHERRSSHDDRYGTGDEDYVDEVHLISPFSDVS